MNKRNIFIIICTLLFAAAMTITVFAGCTASADYNEPVTTISEAYIPSETSTEETTIPEEEVIILENVEVERVEPGTLEEANTALENAMFRKDTAVAVHEGLLLLGYAEDHPAVVLAAADIVNTEADIEYYTEQQAIRQEEYNWQVRAEEYPAHPGRRGDPVEPAVRGDAIGAEFLPDSLTAHSSALPHYVPDDVCGCYLSAL